MSDTPIIDEYAGISEDFRSLEVVSAEVARKIERENEKMKRLCLESAGEMFAVTSKNAELERKLASTEIELEQARAEIERLKCCENCEYCNHRIEVCEHPENSENAIMNDRCEHWQYDKVGR